jgi:uncharacterized membrane protein YecN with MAPEG domain
MELVSFVIALALIECFVFGALVGRARGRVGIEAPAMTGPPEFERINRVHQNSLEQLVLFVPAIWIFASTVSPRIAAALGLVFVVGRVVYARGYMQEASKRSTGMAISGVAQILLLLGAAIGSLLAAL